LTVVRQVTPNTDRARAAAWEGVCGWSLRPQTETPEGHLEAMIDKRPKLRQTEDLEPAGFG
jgi:hypothetical protein